MNDKEEFEITNYINKYRKKHKSLEITYDKTIERYSQTWSDTLLKNNKFEHSNSNLYGENLFYSGGLGIDKIKLIKKAIDNWYNEISKYNFQKPGFSPETGHFTSLIWASSTKYGIGYSNNGKTCIICFNNSPPGNMMSKFKENVLPLV